MSKKEDINRCASVMIDIETLGTSADATVLSVALWAFDPKTGITGNFLHMHLDIHAQLYREREMSWSTIQWWANQSNQAALLVKDDERIRLPDALAAICNFFQEMREKHEKLQVWSCDPTFDLAILRSLFAQFSYATACPWNHWEERSVRTVRQIGRDFGILSTDKDKQPVATHDASDDCVRQINEVATVIGSLDTLYVPKLDSNK